MRVHELTRECNGAGRAAAPDANTAAPSNKSYMFCDIADEMLQMLLGMEQLYTED